MKKKISALAPGSSPVLVKKQSFEFLKRHIRDTSKTQTEYEFRSKELAKRFGYYGLQES